MSDLSFLVPVGCQTDSDCLYSEKCYSGTCHNPCQMGRPCAPRATCTTVNHNVQCSCGPGLTGNPTVRCESIGCTSSNECPSDQTCYRGGCVDPCILAPHCSGGASCVAQDHECVCAPPLVGDPYTGCSLPPTPECLHDSECPKGHGCVNNECTDLCPYMQPCGVGAVCRVVDLAEMRTVVCECPPGYTGSANEECVEEEEEERTGEGCQYDADCPFFQACVGGHCSDPCGDACAPGAECKVINHRPVCYCPPGYTGTGYDRCSPVGCIANDECPQENVCLRNKCVDPCTVANPCGAHAKCQTKQHTTECVCQLGYSGNAYEACIAIGCRDNSACPTTQACVNNFCVDQCEENNPCGSTETCTIQNHQVKCSCPEGHTAIRGECVPPESLPCRSDQDCKEGEACLDNTCQDLCKMTPCGDRATCKALLVQGLATVTCVCAPGLIGDPFRECIAVPTPGCTSHQDCPWDQMCVAGQCVDACKNSPCGEGATCRSIGHRAICTCAAGHLGDPHLACTPGKHHHILCKQKLPCNPSSILTCSLMFLYT